MASLFWDIFWGNLFRFDVTEAVFPPKLKPLVMVLPLLVELGLVL